jgi:hypothetical protein
VNESLMHLRQLSERLPGRAPFNPAANRFFVEDQPTEALLPLDHLICHSPLFARYARRARWLRHGERGMVRFRIAAALGILLLLGALTFLNTTRGFPLSSGSFAHRVIIESTQDAAIWLLIASVPAALLMDMVCISAALRQFRRHPLDDLVQLSRLSSRGIIISHYAAIRLSAWRMMTVVMMMRLIAFAAFVIAQFVLLPVVLRSMGMRGMGFDPETDLFNFLIQTVIIFCLGIAYISEAYWRLNGVAARALVVAASRESSIPIEFVGLFSLFRLWLRQVLLLFIMMFALIAAGAIVIGIVSTWTDERAVMAFSGATALVAFALSLLYVIRGHYLALSQRELHRAEKVAFSPIP